MRGIIFLYLLLNGWTDYKKREIDLRCTLLLAVITAIYKGWTGTFGDWSGILPGALLWILSRLKQGKIGEGDGWVVMAVGWSLGVETIWNIVLTAFMAAGGMGLFYLISGRKKAAEIPFIPFLLLGFVIEEGIR